MLLGPAGVGKSSLLRGLKKLPFVLEGNSTQVADVRPISYNWATGEWSDVNEQDELDEMAKLLAVVYHNEQSVHKLISSVKSVKTLYGSDSSMLSTHDQDVLDDIINTKIDSYLIEAIARAKQLTPDDIQELRPSPFFHVWDCGGQPIFLEVLPAFLTPRTMFLLLFDASNDFNSRWKSIQFQQGKEIPGEEVNMTIFELLDKWMATIHSCLLRKTKEGDLLDYPRILGIGTHGDELNEEKKQGVIARFNALYSEKAFAELLDDILVIDNTTAGSNGDEEDPGFKAVRENIRQFALEKLVVKTPVSWVLFRKIIHMFTEESKNVITFSEAKAIAISCNIKAEDVHKVLMFYHDLGVILYYSHIRGLKDKVVLSPKWFVESLGKVLALQGTESCQTKKMWLLLREKGILIQPLYVAVWKTCEDIDPEGMMELLVRFHLAAYVETEEYYDRTAPQYFVPSVLKLFTEDPPLSIGGTLRATPLHITFSTNFVAPGYFTRFVAIVAGFKACQLHFKNGIYRNLVSFQFGVGRKFDYVTFTELPCAVQVDISRNVPDSQEYTSFSKSCQDLLVILDQSCKEVEECFHQNMLSFDSSIPDIHRKFQFVCKSFECDSSDDIHYLSNTEEGQTQNDPCRCEKVGVFRKLTEEEACWFPSVKHGVQMKKIREREMVQISQEIGGDGELLAAQLEMLTKWHALLRDPTAKDKVINLLFEWNKGEGERDELVKHLKELNFITLAEKLAGNKEDGCVTKNHSNDHILEKRRLSSNALPHLTVGVGPHPSNSNVQNEASTSNGDQPPPGTPSPAQSLPSESDIRRCCQFFYGDIKILSGLIGVTDRELARIQLSYSRNDICALRLIQIWMQKHPEKGKDDLYQLLLDAKQSDAAKSLKDPNYEIKCNLL